MEICDFIMINARDYGGEVLIETRMWPSWSREEIWAVPDWEERGHADLTGPHESVEAARKVLAETFGEKYFFRSVQRRAIRIIATVRDETGEATVTDIYELATGPQYDTHAGFRHWYSVARERLPLRTNPTREFLIEAVE